MGRKKNKNMMVRGVGSIPDGGVQAEVNATLARASRPAQDNLVRKVTAVAQVVLIAGSRGLAITSFNARTLSTEWSSLSAAYAEYRILKIKVAFAPYATLGTGAAPLPVAISVSDFSGSLAVPTTFSQAMTYSKAKLHAAGKPFSHSITATDRDQLTFTPIGVNAVDFYQVAVFFSDNSGANTTAYGLLTYEWTVEFRGRQ